MPIVMRHNEALELTRVDFFGKVLPEHVFAYGSFGVTNPIWIGFDCMTCVSADADVSAITPANIEAIFRSFGGALQPVNAVVRRRTGWICEVKPGQQALLSHWLERRNAGSDPDARVRQFETFEAASDWLLLSPEGAAAFKSGEGFTEIARFETPASLSR
jgi:hypothetical protein